VTRGGGGKRRKAKNRPDGGKHSRKPVTRINHVPRGKLTLKVTSSKVQKKRKGRGRRTVDKILKQKEAKNMKPVNVKKTKRKSF